MAGHAFVYRVDKFIVPEAARDEFLKRVHDTHNILRQQPGFVRDLLLDQIAGPGSFNLVTVAEWESQESVDAAGAVVAAFHAEHGFNPHKTMARLGIAADIGNYKQVDA